MKKKIGFWLLVALGAGGCFWLGLAIAPEQPTLRTLGLFLYAYVCIELWTQFFISKRHRDREEKKREKRDGSSTTDKEEGKR